MATKLGGTPMWKMLTIVAVLASLAAFVMVLNVQHERDEAIRNAIKRHEAEIVQRYAPLLRQIAESSGVTTVTLHPETVQELVAALTEIARQSAANRQAAANSAAMNSLDRPVIEAAETAGTTALDVRSTAADGSHDGESARRRASRARGAPPKSSEAQHFRSGVSSLDHALTPEGEILFAELNHSTGNNELIRMQVASGDKQRIRGNFGSASHPVWSRDGKQIAFVSDRDGQHDIYLLDPRSQEVVRITETPTQESCLTWSADDTRIAFEDQGGIQVLPVDSPGEPIVLSDIGRMPDWSPSRSQVTFLEGAGELRVASVGGGDGRTLLKCPEDESWILARPFWLLDGRSIIVTRWTVTGQDPNRNLKCELLQVNATTGHCQMLPTPPGVFQGLCCSRDGKYVLGFGAGPGDRTGHLYAVRIDDGHYKPIANTGSLVRDASWAIPGKQQHDADALAQKAGGSR